jgi:hypothetical protein
MPGHVVPSAVEIGQLPKVAKMAITPEDLAILATFGAGRRFAFK